MDATDSNTARLIRGNASAAHARLRAAGRAAAARRHDRDRDPPLVQSRPHAPQVLRPRVHGPGAVHLSHRAGRARDVARGRAADHPSGLCLQHLGARVPARQDPGRHGGRAGAVPAGVVLDAARCSVSTSSAIPRRFVAASVLYVFCMAAFASLVGSAIPNQAAAVQAVGLGGFLLSFLLSGLIFPVENIPDALRWISNLVQARYYVLVVRDAFLQGGGWPAVWWAVLAIGGIGRGVLHAGLAFDAPHAGEGVKRAVALPVRRTLLGAGAQGAPADPAQIGGSRSRSSCRRSCRCCCSASALDSDVRNLQPGHRGREPHAGKPRAGRRPHPEPDVPARRLLRHPGHPGRGTRRRPPGHRRGGALRLRPATDARPPGHRAGAAQRREREHRADRAGLRGRRRRLAQPAACWGRGRRRSSCTRRSCTTRAW